MSAPGPENGYRGARFLRDTPFNTVSEWRQAMIDAIPEAERCPLCEGDGRKPIYASNGGLSEFEQCWPCQGTGRRIIADTGEEGRDV